MAYRRPPLARARIDGILVHPGRMLDHSALGTIAPTVFFVSTPSRVPQFPVVQIDDPLGIDTLLKTPDGAGPSAY